MKKGILSEDLCKNYKFFIISNILSFLQLWKIKVKKQTFSDYKLKKDLQSILF